MWKFTWKRMLRSPLPAVGVLLFAVAMAVVLQSLHNSKMEAQKHYEEIYSQIDVTCTVTNLRGTKSDGLDMTNIYVNEFTEYHEWIGESSILPFLEDVQIKSQHKLSGDLADRILVGITSLKMARELWPENGCTIFWNEGFDESMFGESKLLCIIPEKLAKELAGEGEEAVLVDTIPVLLKVDDPYPMRPTEPEDFEGAMQVAGIYTGGDQKTIYCPWLTLMGIWDQMGEFESAVAAQATLRDNSQIAALREASSEFFFTPDPNADNLSPGLALDIDDSKLKEADLTLRNSLRVNELSTLLVFVLAAGAGFLIGFLMVRSRKRDIDLMRTMGTPNGKIYLSFAAEQMLCVTAGTVAEAISQASQPIGQLAVFVGIYFVGLSAALLFFLRSNLLTDIKKDE